MENLAKLAAANVKSRRVSSYDTTGGNSDRLDIPAGKTVTLADISGRGVIKHIWMTTHENDCNLKALVLRAYWDGEETPSILCPLGDFFGLGFGRGMYLDTEPIQASYLAMNCWFPMPYDSRFMFTVTNESEKNSILYYYIDYHENAETAGMGRFHANFMSDIVVKKPEAVGANRNGREERLNTTGSENYLLLNTEGRGHYVGCFLHVDTDEPGWWGEGDDMFFIDGEKWPPNMHGTGTEDYFCGAWNYNQLKQTYNTPYYGYSFKGNADYTGKHSQYRFHIQDPVFFDESLAFSIEHGHANDRQGYWCSTAYWYQTGRSKPLPDTGALVDRIPYAFGGLESWRGRDRKALPRA